MKRAGLAIVILILLAVAAGGGFFFGERHRGADQADDSSQAPATQESDDQTLPIKVTVAPVVQKTISETLTAYGSVIADPGEVRVLSAPFESRIRQVRATPGQAVTPDTELLDLEASPDALLALEDTKNALNAASNDLQQTKQRFNDRLATNQDLSQSQQNYQSAKLKLDSMTQRGIGAVQQIKALSNGIVSKIDVQEGQIIPIGGPLVEIAVNSRIQVKLGVEQQDLSWLKPDALVHLRSVEGNQAAIDGHIRLIGQRVDPTSRLIDVMVSLPSDAHLMLDSFIAGQIEHTADHALVVPRTAIVAEEDHSDGLFTIKDGHAVKHQIRVGIENKDECQIIADDVAPGDLVAVSMPFVLDDGAAVEVVGPASNPAGAPSTQEASP